MRREDRLGGELAQRQRQEGGGPCSFSRSNYVLYSKYFGYSYEDDMSPCLLRSLNILWYLLSGSERHSWVALLLHVEQFRLLSNAILHYGYQ
jgi:hypothetical protein